MLFQFNWDAEGEATRSLGGLVTEVGVSITIGVFLVRFQPKEGDFGRQKGVIRCCTNC